MPRSEYLVGSLMGTQMAISISSRAWPRAPTSSHVVSGTVVNPSRFDEGVIVGKTASKASIVRAVLSKPSGRGAFLSLALAIRRSSS